ncbi:acyl-CoA thioesterase, partial [Azospirillum brasilense]|uniref:acyl-CoA thioesterase n=1 Tax=Azospirillum brasilense TaxID=192 RepID=UPI001FFE8403
MTQDHALPPDTLPSNILLSGVHTVDESWIDLYGHMNMVRYVALFDEVGYALMEQWGLGETYTRDKGLGLFVVDVAVHYRRELRAGTPLPPRRSLGPAQAAPSSPSEGPGAPATGAGGGAGGRAGEDHGGGVAGAPAAHGGPPGGAGPVRPHGLRPPRAAPAAPPPPARVPGLGGQGAPRRGRVLPPLALDMDQGALARAEQ